MKNLLLIFASVFMMISCSSSDCDKESCDKEKCEKKCSSKDKKDCKKKDCKKECSSKDKKECKKDCKKACCSKDGEISTIEIGTALPMGDNMMMDISGENISLNSVKKENGLLVMFSCNTCPFVVGNGEDSEGWENRYNDVKKIADANNIGMILINSNAAKREGVDSFEAMKKHAEEMAYDNMFYVVDTNHVLADKFGARTTPHVFLFNKENNLSYMGSIDDNVNKKEEVKETYLKNAIENMVAGNEINPSTTKAVGCSIKRFKK